MKKLRKTESRYTPAVEPVDPTVFRDCSSRGQVLGVLAGAASVCWTDDEERVFMATRASDLVDLALERLEELDHEAQEEQ